MNTNEPTNILWHLGNEWGRAHPSAEPTLANATIDLERRWCRNPTKGERLAWLRGARDAKTQLMEAK